MTEVVIFTNADIKITGFKCFGHAGFARRNKDIVCSAISILAINTVNSIEKLTNSTIEVVGEEDNALINCRLKSQPDNETELLFRSFEMGILGICDNYGSKYCKVTYKEE